MKSRLIIEVMEDILDFYKSVMARMSVDITAIATTCNKSMCICTT